MKKIIGLTLMLSINYPLYANDDVELENEIRRLQEEKKLWIETVSKQKETKDAAAGIVSVITQDEIKRYGGNSLFEVLNRVTGLYMTGSHLYPDGKAAMRGDLFTHTNNHTLILMNGRPIRDGMQSGINGTVFRDFPIHHIQQIEVIRGAGSVLYGTNAYSGVINIVTKKAQETAITVRGRYGSFNTGQAETELSWKGEQANISAAARYRLSDGWQFSATGERAIPNSFSMKDDDVSASFTGEYQGITFNSFIARNQHNVWGAVATGFGQPYENEKFFVDIGYKKQWNTHWLSQWNLTYNRTVIRSNLSTGNTTPPSLYDALDNSVLLEQTHLLNFFDNRLNIIIGGLVEWQNGRAVQPNVVTPVPTYNHLKSSLYTEINYAILNNLKLTAGGQWNYFQHLETDRTALSKDQPIDGIIGRLGLVYEINPSWGIKLLYSQAFRSPSALELEANTTTLKGNRNLQSERIETADAQIFYHDKTYQASFTVFRSRLSNLINRVPYIGPRFQYANIGNAVFKGIELETQADFKQWHWKGSYSFQTNHTNEQNNATLAPNHSAKFGLSYDITDNLQLGVFDTFFSAAKVLPTALTYNPKAEAYHNLSLNATLGLDHFLGLTATKRINFSIYVDNLLNEAIYYPEFNRRVINTIPASGGRSIFGEIAIEF